MEFLWAIFPKKACCKLVSNIWRRQSHTAQAYRNCLKIMLIILLVHNGAHRFWLVTDKLAYFRKIIAVVVSKIDPLRLKSCQIMASFGSAKGLWISWCLLGWRQGSFGCAIGFKGKQAHVWSKWIWSSFRVQIPRPAPARRGVNDPMMDGNW